MTKEELEKEAEVFVSEKVDKGNFDVEKFGKAYFSESSMKQALVKFAEPREKRIAELEKENQMLKGDLELWESGACRVTNLDKCGVVKELKAQIEELKEKLEITDLALDNCLKDSEVEK